MSHRDTADRISEEFKRLGIDIASFWGAFSAMNNYHEIVTGHRDLVGHVYFASDGAGRVKIGFSKDPEVRVKQLRANAGSHKANGPRKLLAFASTTRREAEGDLHRRFAASQVGGEWFRETTELLDLIAFVKAGGRPDECGAPPNEVPMPNYWIEPSVGTHPDIWRVHEPLPWSVFEAELLTGILNAAVDAIDRVATCWEDPSIPRKLGALIRRSATEHMDASIRAEANGEMVRFPLIISPRGRALLAKVWEAGGLLGSPNPDEVHYALDLLTFVLLDPECRTVDDLQRLHDRIEKLLNSAA